MLAPATAQIVKQSEEGALTHVDTPEFLDAVEADDLLEQLVPVLLAAWRLGEPQSPGVLKSVLDVEVLRVIEDGHDLLAIAIGTVGGISEAAFGRYGNSIERHRLRRVGCAIRSDFCHVAGGWQWCEGGNGMDASQWRCLKDPETMESATKGEDEVVSASVCGVVR